VVRPFLREIREMGLTRPCQMLAGLPDEFSFRKSDIPRPPEDESGGRLCRVRLESI